MTTLLWETLDKKQTLAPSEISSTQITEDELVIVTMKNGKELSISLADWMLLKKYLGYR